MPTVIVLEIVADDLDFGLLVLRPVVGGGPVFERELDGGDDIVPASGNKNSVILAGVLGANLVVNSMIS